MKIVGRLLKWVGIGGYLVCATLIVMFLTPIGGWKALNVLTGSMKPAIQPGALVLIHRVPLSDLRPGDIITYENPRNLKQTITHRVTQIGKVGGLTTVTVKGDANASADKPFPGGLVEGRAAFIIPAAGGFINWLHNPYGLVALVVIPGLIVIWAEARKLRRVLAEPRVARAPKGEEPPPMPHPPVVPSQTPDRPRPVRSLDGMKRVIVLGMVVTAVSLATGSTYAAFHAQVSLTRNRFSAAASPSPSPSPCPGSVIIKNTGPGSTNTVTCTNTNSTTTTNITNITVTNTNHQSAATGLSSGTSGSASNTSSTSTTANVNGL